MGVESRLIYKKIFLFLLPTKYCLHKIVNMNNIWNCHIEPDWILLYYLNDEVLRLERTGTHSDIFK